MLEITFPAVTMIINIIMQASRYAHLKIKSRTK